MSELKKTKLHDRHLMAGAKMVPFAGYDMPVSYPMGVLKEHLHTREKCGLFDVSHMGQCFLAAKDGKYKTVAKALEKLVPADIAGMEPGQQRYTQLLNDKGGILDDLMVSRLSFEGHDHRLYLVVNAGCKDADFKHLRDKLPDDIDMDIKDDTLSLIALQGPKAVGVLAEMNPKVHDLVFMTHTEMPLGEDISDLWVHISRSGYTGEDGFEISVKHEEAGRLVDMLLAHDDVEWVGLGARDSLRLEAGLCLYGNDIDTNTTPAEANLLWSIPKDRRKDANFPGAKRILEQIKDKDLPRRKLVGIQPEGRAPARAGTKVRNNRGQDIGEITSGGFGPSAGGPVAMGYVSKYWTKPGSKIFLYIRGKDHPAEVVKLPFVPHTYYRGQKD